MAKITLNIPSILKAKLKDKCSNLEFDARSLDDLKSKCEKLLDKVILDNCIFYLNNQKLEIDSPVIFKDNDNVNIIFPLAGG